MSADKKPGKAEAIGDQFWLHHYGPYHVRGFVDGQTIARIWSKTRQRWEYRAFHPVELKVYGVQLPVASPIPYKEDAPTGQTRLP